MLQTLQKREVLTLSANNPEETVKSVKSYIMENDCPKMLADISSMNIIDASKTIILCSTYHYVKYPQGHIKWLVCSDIIKNLIQPLNLGNIEVSLY